MSELKIKIIMSDALKFLNLVEDNSVDLVLTDPPYEISRKTGFMNSSGDKTIDRFKMSYEFGDWDRKEINLLPFIKEMFRSLRNGGTLIMFYDLWKISYLKKMLEISGFKQLRFIEWLKTNPVPVNSKINYLTNAREIALTAVKHSKPIFNSKYDKGVYEFPIYHSSDRIHPTQKSVDLFKCLIEKHSREKDLIIDPFMGSGTTGIAAFLTNRNFYGCEIEKDYFDKCKIRLEKYGIKVED